MGTKIIEELLEMVISIRLVPNLKEGHVMGSDWVIQSEENSEGSSVVKLGLSVQLWSVNQRATEAEVTDS
jgi:hypothetical protein